MADAPKEPQATEGAKQVVDEKGYFTVKTDKVVQELKTALQNGFSIVKACELSGISQSTYYNWLKQDEEFAGQMERAKNWALERARQVVVTAIQSGDTGTARWYLERKASDEFGNRNKLEGVIKQENSLTAMTDEQILEMQSRMAKAMGFDVEQQPITQEKAEDESTNVQTGQQDGSSGDNRPIESQESPSE